MLDGNLIGKEEAEVMASKLFEKPMISDKLWGKGAYVTLTIPIDEACNHMNLLYIMAKFDRQ